MKKLIIILIIICLGFYLYNHNNSESNEKFMNFNVQEGDYSFNKVNFNYVREKLDLDYIKNKLSSTSLFDSIPKDSVISMAFFDGNGNLLDGGLTVYGDGSIKDTIVNNYDFKIITGNYYIEELTNPDICSLIRKIKENSDYNIESKLSKPELLWKYRELMSKCLI